MAEAQKSGLQPIPFPFGGVDYFDAYADGNPFGSSDGAPVTQAALNVRGVDMTNSRRRGALRSGLNKYCPFQLYGTFPIQEIASFIASRTDPSASTGQIALNAKDETTGDVGFILIGSNNQVYNITKDLPSTVTLYNLLWNGSTGGLFYQVGTDTVAAQFFLRCVSAAGIVQWTTRFGFTTGSPYIPLGMCLGPGSLAVAVYSSNGASTAGDPGSGGAPGYEIWYFNYLTGAPSGAEPSLVSLGGSPTIGTILRSYNSVAQDTSTSFLGIIESGGLRVLNLANNTSTVVGSSRGVTRAWRVISNNAGSFYWCYEGGAGSEHWTDIHLVSGATSPSIAHTLEIGALSDSGPSSPFSGADVSYDTANSTLWAVVAQTANNTGGVYSLSTSTLSVNGSYPVNNPLGNMANCALLSVPSGGLQLFNYVGNAQTNAVSFASMAAGSPPSTTITGTIYQDVSAFPWIFASANFASAPASGGSYYNAYTYLAVVQGLVIEITTDSGYIVLNKTSPSKALSSTAAVIYSAQQGDNLYFADGVSTIYYDSVADATKTWAATAGSLPIDNDGNYPRLICLWRNRIVQAGLLDDASNWFMSAVGDATNWNYAPTTIVATQAVAGNNSNAGQVGDVINTLIPYNDDILIFGGARSIWQMTGDPMSGGQIDCLSTITGMPFGKPWCIDPSNVLYFVGSRGGVFSMAPGSQPVRMSTQTIDAQLEEIDYSATIVRMVWDDLEQGMHVFLSPIVAGETTHFWYDARNQAWWPDQFGSTNYNALTVCVLNGSRTDDRVILLGGLDGYVRKKDESASTDDGLQIGANVMIGPFYNVTVQEIQITLAATSTAVTVQVFIGANAEAAINSSAVWNGSFSTPGRNHSQNPMIYGNCLYYRVIADGSFGIEQFIVRMKQGSPGRQRIF